MRLSANSISRLSASAFNSTDLGNAIVLYRDKTGHFFYFLGLVGIGMATLHRQWAHEFTSPLPAKRAIVILLSGTAVSAANFVSPYCLLQRRCLD